MIIVEKERENQDAKLIDKPAIIRTAKPSKIKASTWFFILSSIVGCMSAMVATYKFGYNSNIIKENTRPSIVDLKTEKNNHDIKIFQRSVSSQANKLSAIVQELTGNDRSELLHNLTTLHFGEANLEANKNYLEKVKEALLSLEGQENEITLKLSDLYDDFIKNKNSDAKVICEITNKIEKEALTLSLIRQKKHWKMSQESMILSDSDNIYELCYEARQDVEKDVSHNGSRTFIKEDESYHRQQQ